MSTRKLALAGLIVGVVVLVVLQLRQQAQVDAFDQAYGKLLDVMAGDLQKAQADPSAFAAFYDQLPRYKQAAAELPATSHPVREALRQRLTGMLDGVSRAYQEAPLQARSQQMLGQIMGELMDQRESLAQGVAHLAEH